MMSVTDKDVGLTPWTQSEVTVLQCAIDVITDMKSILSALIAEEYSKLQPDAGRLFSLRTERSRLSQEQAKLRIKDHAEIARIEAEYGALVLMSRSDTYVESRARQEAVNFARASVGLEGLKPSAASEQQAFRFIAGEIDLPEFLKSAR